MVTSGIWRPVKIRFYDAASINDYHIKQLSLTEHSAELSNELEINNILPQSIQAEIRINYSFEKGEEKDVITISAANILDEVKDQIKSIEVYYNPHTTEVVSDIENTKYYHIITRKEV